MRKQIVSMGVILALVFTTAVGSVARVSASPVQTGATAVTVAEAEAATGKGWLSCGGSILGGFMIGSTLLGATVGAALIGCGCDDELDGVFGTNFKQACS